MSLYIKYQLTKNMNLIDKNTEVNVLMEHADNVLSDFMQRLEKEFIIKQSKFGNELLSGIDAKKKMLKGIMKLKDVVCSTIGVNGMYVLYEDARTTQDGVTVANNFTLKDKVENYAITLVRDAASKTADTAGDGCQDLNSRILTPTGFRRFGDLKIGDVICGTNGTFQTVEGIYPKGVKQLYKFTFSEGRTTEACESHVWKVTTNYGKEKIMTTKQLLESNRITMSKSNGNLNYGYYTPNTFVDFKEVQPLELDPYFLGCLLGDGSLSGTGAIELSLGANKEHIIDKLVLPSNTTYTKNWVESKNYFRVKFKMIDPSDNTEFVATKLKDLGLFGTNSHTKFIPEQYLYSSLETRTNLLQGLLDTDGSKNERGLYSFSSVNQKLAEQVLELFRGLGRPAVLRKIIKEGKDSYSNNPIYEVTERKGYKHGTKLISIEPTDKFVEVQCIKVSNEDSLYITEDYIVTHNTTSTTAITSKLVELFVKALEEDPELNLHECFTFLEQLKLQAIDYLNANKQVITKDDKGLQLIRDIAYTSSHNNDDIADAIKSLYSKLEDWNTDVSFEFNDLDADSVEMNEGYNIGHRANAFSGNRKEFESARLFVYPDKVDKIPLNFLQYIISKRTRDNSPVVLFAKHFDKSVELEATRIKEAYGVELYLIRSDTYGESQKTQFEDLCRILNINMLTKEDMSSYGRDLEYNEGYLKSLILTNEECYFVFTEDSIPIKSEITKECEQLIKSSKDKALKEMTQNRLKRLQFSKCTYFIGGITTSETANKYYLIEDAILAVKSAIKQGVVHGGCYDYIQMTEHLKKINTKLKKSQDLVLNIFVTSMLHTFELQCANSFEDYTSRLNTIIETKRMFNFKDRQFYMLENNKIKDSYSTSINCIQNAISIAKMIMLTNHIIY